MISLIFTQILSELNGTKKSGTTIYGREISF